MTDYESEIHRLLKIGPPRLDGESRLGGPSEDHSISHAPEQLPVSHNSGAVAVPIAQMPEVGKNLKSILVYPFIFLGAFVFFYFILNFSAIWAQVEGYFSKPQAEQIMGTDTAEYYKWIGNYFYAVGDQKLLEPTNDLDKDGLSNHDEFVMRTNPILSDSDNDGFSDGIEVINNHNPWGTGPMTSNQRELAQGLDLIMVNNRISYNVSTNKPGAVSGTATANFDLERAGRLSIPKLNLSVPLIWSKDTSTFDADLTKGVIHYPGTALPGENGIVYVSGHSSDYIWKRNPMQNVFARINQLSNGDDIFIDVYGKDGKVYNFRYQVQTSKTYTADDQTQFIDSSGSKLNLSTCWPIGTQKDRLVVTAVPVEL